jgi:CBS domain-containing protein
MDKPFLEKPYKTLKQILAEKPAGTFAVAPDDTVLTALQAMAEKNVGAVVVLDGGRLIGMFSERDYARKGVLAGRASKDTPVRDVMTERVIHVMPEASVPQCMALMTEKRIRHLPVVENQRVIGVVSIGDLVKEVISHHERVIRDLEAERVFLTVNPGSY